MGIFNNYNFFQISTSGMSSLPSLDWDISLVGAINILLGFLKYCANFMTNIFGFIDKIVSFKTSSTHLGLLLMHRIMDMNVGAYFSSHFVLLFHCLDH